MPKQHSTCIPCGVQTFRRNTYFNGKLLTERDFTDEQVYMVAKDWLHNKLLHGQGTVCGLKVVAHPNPDCQDKFAVIEPGVALDCCGREIVVTNKMLVPIQQLLSDENIATEPPGRFDLFLGLCFEETPEETIPVLLSDCDCADAGEAHNRVREGCRVRLFSQLAGQRLPARPPLEASLDWQHTITLPRQSPRAVVADDQLQQLYIAAQAVAADDGEVAENLEARLYAFRTDTHDLITAVNAGREPTDLALSLLGDRIYLATTIAAPEVEARPGIAVFLESKIRSQIEPAGIIPLQGPARLLVSPLTGALFALVLDNGNSQSQLLRWSDEALRDWLDGVTPTAVPSAPLALPHTLDGRAGAAMCSITLDGRYIFIADSANQTVRVVEVATFTELTHAMTPHGTPVAVATSRDSAFLYVLWSTAEEAGAARAMLTRYEIDDSAGAFALREDGQGGRWSAEPLDLSLAPNERWAYVLQKDEGRSQVCTIDIEQIARPVGPPSDARGTRESISGSATFQRLAVLGGRLYLAADDESTETQPERGLVAVLRVQQAACDSLFTAVVEGCPGACATEDANDPSDHCVVLAHIPAFRRGAKIKNASDAGPDDNAIDNLTHRSLVPSSNNIVEVIRCMLDQGLAEGVPGPRGPSGERGPRGPAITEATATTLQSGSAATANLEPIAGDLEGDQRLILGIPRGPRGESGPRGPGITQATVAMLPPGAVPTAALSPIPGDPEGDQRLDLGIPSTEAAEFQFARIRALSWIHDQSQKPPDVQVLLTDSQLDTREATREGNNLGLVILFDRDVRMDSVFKAKEVGNSESPTRSEVFQLYVRVPAPNTALMDELFVPGARHQAVEVLGVDANNRINKIQLRQGAPVAKAVRLVFKELPRDLLQDKALLRIVFRADFALDEQGRAVDGNHIGGLVPLRPSGNGREGTTFESWFYIGPPDFA